MANFLITTSNSLTLGTDTQDLFDLRDGSAVSIVAAGGADTIVGSANLYTAANLQGGAGNDTVTFSPPDGGLVLDRAAILLGAGDDQLTIAANAVAGTSSAAGGVDITGGGGNDNITIATGATFAGGSSINGNQGNDTITVLSGGLLRNSLIAGGGDNDVINAVSTINLSSSTVNGGGGNDAITLSGTISNTRIEGDTLNESVFFGNDTITIAGNFGSSSIVQGGLGNDNLVFTAATFTTGASVEGGAGTDSIRISGFTINGATFVGGGAGVDEIIASGALVNNFGTIQGGGGNDLIVTTGGAANGGFIFGGEGADFIDLGIVAAAGQAGAASGVNIAYSNFSESTLGSTDTVLAQSQLTGAFMISQGVTNFSVVAFNGNGVSGNAAGQAVFSGGTDNLTARATLLDSTLANGNAVVFQTQGSTFLFVQNGAAGSGTSGDLLVELIGDASGAIAQAGSIARVSNSELKVNFVG